MTSAERVLAVDIGTSSVRAQVFTETGDVLARAKAEYSCSRPRPGHEEQDPDVVRESTFRAMADCVAAMREPASIGAISFSSQLYSVIAVDADGRPLSPSITWADSRAQKEADLIAARSDATALRSGTGCPADSIFPLAKLLWLRTNEPDVFKGARRFVSIKEYVTSVLIGDWAVDTSVASATGLLDIRSGHWLSAALDLAEVEAERLSAPVSGLVPFRLRKNLPIAFSGLRPDIKVFLGAGDGPLANLGSGAFRPGAVNVDLGTSGAARGITTRPGADEAGGLWCFCLSDDLWVTGGIITNVGNALHWLATTFEPDRPVDESIERFVGLAAEVGPGAAGLSFVPYLRAARSPSWDGRLRGLLHGLRADHGAAHITQALLEAIAYDLKTITTLIDQDEPIAEPLRLTGGLARSPHIAQLVADVCGRHVLVPQNTEGSVAGAALFGLHGMGVLDAFVFDGAPSPTSEYLPDASAEGPYVAGHRRHERLIDMMRSFAATEDLG